VSASSITGVSKWLPLETHLCFALSANLPAAAQFNWISGRLDIRPEQIDLPLPPLDDAILPADGTVALLATENGSQTLRLRARPLHRQENERVVVKKGKSVCAQVPLMRLQEIIIASRGVSFSSDLLEELCERGIRVACLTSSGKPFALLTSPMLTATVEPGAPSLMPTLTTVARTSCWIVAGKLHNREKLMRYFAKSRDGERKSSLESAAASLRR
jgi:hypothetical protein